MINVVDVICEIVGKTSAVVEKSTGKKVFYQYGNIIELDGILQSYSNSTKEFREQKYPAIFLLTDFRERRNSHPDYETEAFLQLLIVEGSMKEYSTADRYGKVFKPVLHPIYEAFIKQLEKDSRIVKQKYGVLPHDFINRSLISGFELRTQSGKTKNLFSDYIDAVEINNLNLIILKNCMI
ncbi:MAG: hypothetical protein LBL04_10190 [Bacteroidales bacterium]|jgi:hypothetical protein|nr:hypothetical protein [Bacteroidales bacterium]